MNEQETTEHVSPDVEHIARRLAALDTSSASTIQHSLRRRLLHQVATRSQARAPGPAPRPAIPVEHGLWRMRGPSHHRPADDAANWQLDGRQPSLWHCHRHRQPIQHHTHHRTHPDPDQRSADPTSSAWQPNLSADNHAPGYQHHLDTRQDWGNPRINGGTIAMTTVTLEHVIQPATQLPPAEKLRLIEQMVAQLGPVVPATPPPLTSCMPTVVPARNY